MASLYSLAEVLFMLFSMMIKHRAGQNIRMGVVSSPALIQPFLANRDRTQRQALEFEVFRNLGQSPDDPADDVFFELLAGAGHGEVSEAEVTVVFKNPRTHA